MVVYGEEYPWVLDIKWYDARTLVFDSVYRTKQSSEGSSSACKNWRDIRVICPATANAPDRKSLGDPTPARTERGVTTIPSRAVRFTETFESPEAGKLPATSPEPGRFYAGYEDGEYVVRLTKPVKGTLARIGLPGIHTDVELSVDARLVKGIDDAVIVLGCRANTDYGEEYRLRIDPARARYGLAHWIDGEEKHSVWYSHMPVVNPDRGTNHVRLFCGRTCPCTSIKSTFRLLLLDFRPQQTINSQRKAGYGLASRLSPTLQPMWRPDSTTSKWLAALCANQMSSPVLALGGVEDDLLGALVQAVVAVVEGTRRGKRPQRGPSASTRSTCSGIECSAAAGSAGSASSLPSWPPSSATTGGARGRNSGPDTSGG